MRRRRSRHDCFIIEKVYDEGGSTQQPESMRRASPGRDKGSSKKKQATIVRWRMTAARK